MGSAERPRASPSVLRFRLKTIRSLTGFEGITPEVNYGAGEVDLLDKGIYIAEGSLSTEEQWKSGELKIILYGPKLNGGCVLVQIRNVTKEEQRNPTISQGTSPRASRLPRQLAGTVIYQKEAGPSIPARIRTVDIYSETQAGASYFVIDVTELRWLVKLKLTR